MKSLWFDRALLPSGWAERVSIFVNEGRIASATPGTDPAPGDECHALALPGLCNVHSHGFQRGMAGLSEHRGPSGGAGADDDFWSWREVMYRFLDHLTPDDIEAITAQAYVEMLEGGFTRVGEFHYLHHDVDGGGYGDCAETAGAIVAAAETCGIGLTLLPVFYAHSDFSGLPPKPGQRRFISDFDGFGALFEASRAKLSGDMQIGIAPHSLRAVTGEELTALLAMCPDGPIHIHAAEQVKEVEASLAFSGQRPVEWLLDHAGIDQRWCLIHATHLSQDETDRLAASGAVAGLCPVTEANLGDGIFPAERYLAQGGRIGLGTDSNIMIGAADELRALEYSQRLSLRRRVVLASEDRSSVGRRLFEQAVSGGAQALGVEGGLTVGAPADIVSLDLNHPALFGAQEDGFLDRWIFAARGNAIDTVWRGGKKLVSGGQHIGAEAVTARYQKVVGRLN